jgi:flagellar hook-length control protein FliK
MDANLSSLTLNAPSASTGLTAAAGPTPAAALRGADFANLLGSLLADPGRQGLAADGLAGVGLQAFALSPQMELITPATPVPDTGSLVAFARTQGLDESTLTALFGDSAVQASAPGELAGGNWAGLNGLMMPVAPTSNALPAGGATGLSMLAAAPANLAGRPELAAGMVGASLIKEGGPATLTVMGASELSWQIGKTPVTPGASGLLGVAPATEVNAAETSDAMRLQLMLPREAITALTRRLAGMAGSGQAVAWGGLTASALASAGVAQGRIDLREFFSADVLDAAPADAPLTSPGSSLEAPRTAASPLTLTAEGTPEASQAGQRIEHYQQLADRLGQALAQRLQAQIERGEWKVQMRMDPASLGRIDMELDMRAGGLDAVFRSDNPLTRELIAQGLPKLKESLSQSGTAVANVWVNGDSARQSGGNPTPHQNPSNGAWKQGEDDKGQGGQTVELAPVAGVRQGSASTDWDVLA